MKVSVGDVYIVYSRIVCKHVDSTELIEFDDDDFYKISESNQMMNSILAREIQMLLCWA